MMDCQMASKSREALDINFENKMNLNDEPEADIQ